MNRPRRVLATVAITLLVLTGCSGGVTDGAADSDPNVVATAPPPVRTSTAELTTPAGRPTAPTSETVPDAPRTPTAPSTTSSTSASPSPPPPSGSSDPVSWPAVGLPSVNDPACTDDRLPVLLLHGTFSTAASNFGPLARGLVASGHCVYALDYGQWGTAPVKDSAAAVAAFARQVLAATGADQLDVVGYSQGGLVLRTALRLDGLAALVRTAVLIAPSFHGTALADLGDVPLQLCPACRDQLVGSELLAELDQGGDLDGRVRYAVLSTTRDQVVLPVSGQSPVGPTDRVRSTLVEDLCPTLVTDHVALPATAAAVSWTLGTLDEWPAPVSAVSC